MAQFTSYPAARPQPFAIYNNQRSTLMSELGEALTALGNIPQQIEQNKIKSELNKLLLTSLTAPRTEQKTVQGPPEFTGTIEGEWPSNQSMLTPPGQQNVQDFFKPGSMLTKQVPGEKYAEATGRLEDVGYKAGGFDFGPTSGSQLSLADRILLKKLDIEGKKDVEGTKATGRSQLEDQRHANAMKKQDSLLQGVAKRSLDHDERLAKIDAQGNKSKEEIAKERLAEIRRHNLENEKAMRDLNSIRRSAIGSREDINLANAIDKQLTEMRAQDAQISKILGLDQNDPNTIELFRAAISRYNAARTEIIKLDPNYSDFPEKRIEDYPWYRDPAQLMPGNRPAQRLVPTPGQTTNPPPRAPTQPRNLPRNPAGTPEVTPPTTPRVDQPLTPAELKAKRDKVYELLNKPQY